MSDDREQAESALQRLGNEFISGMSDGDEECQRCGQAYLLRFDEDPTTYCDHCAHAVVDEQLKEIERLRAALAAAGDGDTWHAACKRLEKELAERTQERDEAREAARLLFHPRYSETGGLLLERWPWLGKTETGEAHHDEV